MYLYICTVSKVIKLYIISQLLREASLLRVRNWVWSGWKETQASVELCLVITSSWKGANSITGSYRSLWTCVTMLLVCSAYADGLFSRMIIPSESKYQCRLDQVRQVSTWSSLPKWYGRSHLFTVCYNSLCLFGSKIFLLQMAKILQAWFEDHGEDKGCSKQLHMLAGVLSVVLFVLPCHNATGSSMHVHYNSIFIIISVIIH